MRFRRYSAGGGAPLLTDSEVEDIVDRLTREPLTAAESDALDAIAERLAAERSHARFIVGAADANTKKDF